MKRVKKLLSLVLAMMLVLAMGSTVMAGAPTEPPKPPETTIPGGDNAHTITIMNVNKGHTYGAYQVFKGTFYQEGNVKKLSNINWGDNIDGDGLLEDLKADNTFGAGNANVFADCMTAEDVAGVLAGITDAANLEAFAKWADENLTSGPAETSTEGTAGEGEKIPYTINVTGDGYYLVKDIGQEAVTAPDAFTKYILQVIGDVNLDAKAEAPSLTKKIVKIDADGNETETTMNDVNVGDSISFKLTFNVPAMYNFSKYIAIVEDIAGDGLTFNNDPVITIGNTTLERGTDYTVVAITVAEDGTVTEGETIAAGATIADGQDFRIKFTDLIALQAKYNFNTGDEVLIRYTSTVNEKAFLTMEGNKNEAKLMYSNDPSNPENPNGETPKSTTVSYAAGVRLKKVAVEGENKISLSGAQFTFSGVSSKKVLTTGFKFVEPIEIKEGSGYTLVEADRDKNYYLLKDKTYTSTAPTESNKDSYEDTDTVYKKVSYSKYEDSTEEKTITAEVDENGILIFNGLGEGKYTITEIKAPDGYNLLPDPIYVEIEFDPIAKDENGENKVDDAGNPVMAETPKWNAYRINADGSRQKDDDGNDIKIASVEDNMFELEVVNQSGAQLPSTGGIGTTIFYVLGGILVVGAGIMLVVKKRMSSEK